MYENSDSYNGSKVTAKGDPRITPIGKWLRDTKLNELPQLWNILKGDMSLVGPRPEDPSIVKQWSEEVFHEVLSVKPGITSAASILYRNEETLLQSNDVMSTYMETVLPDKLRLDQIYVRNRCFLLDLDILFWTILAIIPSIWPVDPPEELLFWGPISRLMRRYMSWFSIDTITTFIAFGLASVLWRSMGPLNLGYINMLILAVAFSLLFSLIGAIVGIQRVHWSKALAQDILYLIPAVGIAMILALFLNQSLGLLPTGLLVLASGFAFIGFVIVRYRTRLLTGAALQIISRRRPPAVAQEKVLIVGGGDAGQFAAWMLNQNTKANAFKVVGFVDDDLYKQGQRIRGSKVLGRSKDISTLVQQQDIGVIVYAIHNISKSRSQMLLETCRSTGAKIVELPDFLGAMTEAMSSISKEQPLEKTVSR